MISTRPPTKHHGPGGGWVGIRGGSVLVPGRPAFWIAAEVVLTPGPVPGVFFGGVPSVDRSTETALSGMPLATYIAALPSVDRGTETALSVVR